MFCEIEGVRTPYYYRARSCAVRFPACCSQLAVVLQLQVQEASITQ